MADNLAKEKTVKIFHCNHPYLIYVTDTHKNILIAGKVLSPIPASEYSSDDDCEDVGYDVEPEACQQQ